MIISVNGKINSGKDTVGEIIQYLCYGADKANISFDKWNREPVWGAPEDNFYKMSWDIKKFAGKLKDIVCLLIGCTRKQLEDHKFKEKELGEAWNKYTTEYPDYGRQPTGKEIMESSSMRTITTIEKMTPRTMLQLLGTEAGRQIIHENIWVNSLMCNYILTSTYNPLKSGWENFGDKYKDDLGNIVEPTRENTKYKYPDWLITDMRFPNELEAVKKMDGITIRINRPFSPETISHPSGTYKRTSEGGYLKVDDGIYKSPGGKMTPHDMEFKSFEAISKHFDVENMCSINSEHISETALDNAEFDYVIDNNSDITSLIEKVRKILIKENIIDEIFKR